MNSTTETQLTISYTGDPVGVDPEQITDEMFVPNVGRDSPLHAGAGPLREVFGCILAHDH
jgi:hypothetical protein